MGSTAGEARDERPAGTMRPWTELRTTDFRGIDPERCLVLLPVAAVEQHGPHLPLGTDARILEGVLERLADRVPAGVDLRALPLQAVGDSLEHRDFAGTLNLDSQALVRAWVGLGACARRAGIRKIAIVNSHAGQGQLVDLAAQELRADERMVAARVNTYRLGVPPGLFAEDELRFGYHGGEVETSMMLALAPETVDMDAARDFPSEAEALARRNATLHAEGDVGFAWQAQDLNPEGAMGNAAAADAERGAAVLDHLAARLASALGELAAFPLDALRDRPE